VSGIPKKTNTAMFYYWGFEITRLWNSDILKRNYILKNKLACKNKICFVKARLVRKRMEMKGMTLNSVLGNF